MVFLQELIPPYLEYLKKRAVSYTIIEGRYGLWLYAIMAAAPKEGRAILLGSRAFSWYFDIYSTFSPLEGNEEGYFTGIMLKKSRVKLLKSEIVGYPTTQMMRNLLVAKVS